MLDAALSRHVDAPAEERVPALVYRAEIAIRLDDPGTARSALAEIQTFDLDTATRERLHDDLDASEEIARQLP